MNMQSQTLTLAQSAVAPQAARRAPFALPALVRLALLVGPLTLTVLALGHAPVACVLACAAVLTLWLTVDVGPFRAAGVERTADVPVRVPP